MKKTDEPVSICYAGKTILIDTISGFNGVYQSQPGSSTKHGIHFVLRSGTVIEAIGDCQLYRDRVLNYLNKRIGTIKFVSDRCGKSSCANFIQTTNPDYAGTIKCDHNAGNNSCYSYNGYPKWKSVSEEEGVEIHGSKA